MENKECVPRMVLVLDKYYALIYSLGTLIKKMSVKWTKFFYYKSILGLIKIDKNDFKMYFRKIMISFRLHP